VIGAITAALFYASSHTAAVLAKATPEQEDALRDYGLHLGMCFQIVDDLLDYSGDPEKMGKNAGDDLAEGKVTLPLIYAMEQGVEQRQLIYEAVKNKSVDNLDEIVALVSNCGALEYTRQQAEAEAEKAKSLLSVLPDNEYRTALSELVDLAINRSN